MTRYLTPLAAIALIICAVVFHSAIYLICAVSLIALDRILSTTVVTHQPTTERLPSNPPWSPTGTKGLAISRIRERRKSASVNNSADS